MPKTPLHVLSPDGARRLRDQGLAGMSAVLGVDAPAHLRSSPTQEQLQDLSPEAIAALEAIYDDPYSTRAERDGEEEAPDRSGTRPGAVDKVVSMCGLLTIAQCRIGARGDELRHLVDAYFADRQFMRTIGGTLDKQEENWRRARGRLPMFETAATTRRAVLCALRLYVHASSTRAARAQMRDLKARIMHESVIEGRSGEIEAVMLAATDFTHHTDAQLDRTFAKLRAAKLSRRRAQAEYMRLMTGAIEETSDVLSPVVEGLRDPF